MNEQEPGGAGEAWTPNNLGKVSRSPLNGSKTTIWTTNIFSTAPATAPFSKLATSNGNDVVISICPVYHICVQWTSLQVYARFLLKLQQIALLSRFSQ